MTEEPQAKLGELIVTLTRLRIELDLAMEHNNPTLITSAQRLVYEQHQIIRQHCDLSGLPLPADVPEKE